MRGSLSEVPVRCQKEERRAVSWGVVNTFSRVIVTSILSIGGILQICCISANQLMRDRCVKGIADLDLSGEYRCKEYRKSVCQRRSQI